MLNLFITFLALPVVHGSPVQVMIPLASLESSWDWRDMKPFKDKSLAELDIKMSKSQDREDIWLAENWFYNINNATIVESGAYNGYDLSNTYFYEHFAHWNIIHIGDISCCIPLCNFLL
jgi:hypothetical protein